jgi:hypothetical protein
MGPRLLVVDMKNKSLYEALVSFPLAETGGRYTFLHRLCRENRWTRAEGERAIFEYKRFLYLARVSPDPVTPPEAVDQVWHLHLLYTRSYWEEMCGGILGRPLHHGPTKGGAEEDEKFGDWYGRTRALYEAEFGAAPAARWWPARFSPEKRYRWTDLARNWVIPKPSFTGLMPGVFPLLLLGDKKLPVLVVAVIFVVIGAIVVAALREATDTEKRKKGGDGGDVFGGFDGVDSGGDCGDSGGDCGGGDGGGGCGGGCGGGD